VSLYNVVGNPVEHSKSPYIHQLFAAQTGEDLEYRAVKVEADNFDNFVKEFFIDKGAGLNITVPFKEAAYRLSHEVRGIAKKTGAVILRFTNEEILDKAVSFLKPINPGYQFTDTEKNNEFVLSVSMTDKKLKAQGLTLCSKFFFKLSNSSCYP